MFPMSNCSNGDSAWFVSVVVFLVVATHPPAFKATAGNGYPTGLFSSGTNLELFELSLSCVAVCGNRSFFWNFLCLAYLAVAKSAKKKVVVAASLVVGLVAFSTLLRHLLAWHALEVAIGACGGRLCDILLSYTLADAVLADVVVMAFVPHYKSVLCALTCVNVSIT
jgi:hypothetical protein